MRRWALGTVVLALAAGVPAATASAAAPTAPQLTAIRAGAHPGFERLVFQFAGGVPSVRSVAWVPQVVADASGLPVPLQGRAFLRVVFSPATAHTEAGTSTLAGTLPRTYDFAVVRQVAAAGDFENVLSFGIGTWQKTAVRVHTLRGPARVVLDFTVPPPGHGTATLREIDRGRTVHLSPGQTAVVRLRTCVSCGYAWRVTRAPAPSVVRVVSLTTVPLPHPPGIVGFPSETVVTLKAVGPGFTSLLLDEFPPGSSTPVARYLVHFRVH